MKRPLLLNLYESSIDYTDSTDYRNHDDETDAIFSGTVVDRPTLTEKRCLVKFFNYFVSQGDKGPVSFSKALVHTFMFLSMLNKPTSYSLRYAIHSEEKYGFDWNPCKTEEPMTLKDYKKILKESYPKPDEETRKPIDDYRARFF